jgi:hypothetical protein
VRKTILLEQEFLEIFANRTETPGLMEYKGSLQTRDFVSCVQGVVSVGFKGKTAQASPSLLQYWYGLIRSG